MAKPTTRPAILRASLTCIFHRESIFDFFLKRVPLTWIDRNGRVYVRGIIDRSNRFTIRSPLETLLIPSITPSPWKPYDIIESRQTRRSQSAFGGRKLLFEIGEKGMKLVLESW